MQRAGSKRAGRHGLLSVDGVQVEVVVAVVVEEVEVVVVVVVVVVVAGAVKGRLRRQTGCPGHRPS